MLTQYLSGEPFWKVVAKIQMLCFCISKWEVWVAGGVFEMGRAKMRIDMSAVGRVWWITSVQCTLYSVLKTIIYKLGRGEGGYEKNLDIIPYFS